MKWLISIVLLMIVFSLGSALYYMMKDKGNSSRMVHSLMLRIGLSCDLLKVFCAWSYNNHMNTLTA